MARFLIGHNFDDLGVIDFGPGGEPRVEAAPGEERYMAEFVRTHGGQHGKDFEQWIALQDGERQRGCGLWVKRLKDGEKVTEWRKPPVLPPYTPRKGRNWAEAAGDAD
jgi:hypothetical protein